MTYIYGLVDPYTKEVRYIGKSIRPQRRFVEHLRDKQVCHKTNWIHKLIKNGTLPLLAILESVDDGLGNQREMVWISLLRRAGSRLVNSTDGGEGLLNPSPETRKKISVARQGKPTTLGRKASAETRAKISHAREGKTASEETKRKMSLARVGNTNCLGYKYTEETKRKVGLASSKRKHTEATKKKISMWNTGKIVSEETKREMSAAKSGQKMSKECKEKISRSLMGNKNTLGYKHTEEARRKMSEAQKKRNEKEKQK